MKHAETFPQAWRSLVQAFQMDAASARVDTLATNFAAKVGATGYEPCIGIVKPNSVASYWGLVYLLAGYGLELRQRPRASGDSVFLYAGVMKPEPDEFEGATIRAVRNVRRAVQAVA